MHNNPNFNCKVKIRNINLDNFMAVNNLNMLNLTLPTPLPRRQLRQRCIQNTPVNPPSFNRSSTTSNNTTRSPSSQCRTCKRFFKGRRGLNIHLSRNPACNRNTSSKCLPYHNINPTVYLNRYAILSKVLQHLLKAWKICVVMV